jgi:hypothetical protein
VVLANTATAVGLDELAALSEARERAGDLVGAAKTSWAASHMKGIDQSIFGDLVFRTTDLLEVADNAEAMSYEAAVLSVAFGVEIGSPRNSKSQARARLLGTRGNTFEIKVCAALASYTVVLENLIYKKNGEPDLRAALDGSLQHSKFYLEAAELTSNETWRSFARHLMHAAGLGYQLMMSFLPEWDPAQFGTTEEDAIAAIKFYQYRVCGRILKESSFRTDYFRAGYFLPIFGLWYGNLSSVLLWHQKTLDAFEEIDVPSTNLYREELYEVWLIITGAVPTLIMLNLFEEAASLLEVVGFTWGEEICEASGVYFEDFGKFEGADATHESLHCRMCMILSSAPNTIDEAEVNAMMPSPKAIAELDRNYVFGNTVNAYQLPAFGARIFLKLGRDDDAYELASLAVAPEQQTKKKFILSSCHSILGEIAAKRGQLDEADGHFSNALKEAKLSRLPMLEVLAVRDWKTHLLTPHGRDCSACDATIDAACARMNKTREDIASVLSPKPPATWTEI